MTPPTDETPAVPPATPDAATPEGSAGGDRPSSGAAEADSSGRAAEADPRGERVAEAVKAWQRHLVDLGGRNTLLWYRDLPSGTLDLTTAHPGGLAMLMAGRPTRLSDLVREPAALDEARRRARVIRAKTLELSEERGIAAGFIAIGMASWTVRGASRAPAAPVLLRSCVLKPTGAAREDFDLDLGNDVELNPVLEHYLRSEQGLDLDSAALEELATASGAFDPHPVYAELARLCASVPDFSVMPRLVVGTFSYAKLPMVADLAAQGDSLADHDVIAALAGDPGALRAVRTSVPDSPADSDPAHELLILDADSTQQAAIDAVRSGAHLVIKGPPGTGKSQTIANLIASLAGEGKRVLFVAEKRAAIDAVLSRLDGVGLGDLVLDAYDGASNRRRLAQQFGAALERGSQVQDPDTTEIEQALVDRRATLVQHAAALHEVRQPWGVSAHQAQEAISSLGGLPHPPTSRVRVRGDQLAALDRQHVKELGRQLTEAASLGAWSTQDGRRPRWFGARIATSEEAVRARDITSRLSQGGLQDVEQTMHDVFSDVSLPQADRVGDWGDVLDSVGRVRDTLEVFRPEIFDIPLGDLVAATGSKAERDANGVALGWYSRWRLRRQARSLLRPGPPPADLHAALLDAQTQRTAWQQMAGAGGRPEIPVDLDRARTAYQAVSGDLAWLGERLTATHGGGDLFGATLGELRERMAELDARPDRLAVVPQVLGTLDALRESGMGALLDDLARRGVEPDDVAAELDFVWWASLSEDLTVRDPRYGAHDGAQLQRVAREYVAADHAHLRASADRVRAGAGRRLREVLADHPDQEALVRAEAGKSRRHRLLRDLLPKAAETLTAAKPAWAMSPLVVASVLPPGRWFDVVIFDEASQIPPAQAVSAISRAHQVVVAGDERQLPPTSFFTAAVDEDAAPESDALTEGFESVLDVLTAALPTRRLSWHYRSLDERLVAFANREMYDGSLVTFPGTGTDAVVRLESVEGSGVVQTGEEAIESTEAEVSRVVELVLEHARTRPHESLGVIALGIKHATRLDDALRRALASDAAAGVGDFFDEDRPERFFVKNLERVQGDERDAIILAVGYGKTPHGRVLHRFGPLNLEGGERRLNVAITRARRRMTVVSSLLASDLDPARLKARGAVMLRDFLAYAADGSFPARSPSIPPSPLQVIVQLERCWQRGPTRCGRSSPAGCATPGWWCTRPTARPGSRSTSPSRTPTTAATCWSRSRRTARRMPRCAAAATATGCAANSSGGSAGCTSGSGRPTCSATRPATSPGSTPPCSRPSPAGRPPCRSRSSRARSGRPGSSRRRRPRPTSPPRRQRQWRLRLLIPPRTQMAPADPAPTTPDPVSPAPPAPEAETFDEFLPTSDEGARQRRVRGRKGKRVIAPATSDQPDAPTLDLPAQQTKDDTDAGWGEGQDESAHDRWLREQRPPHWGSD